MTEIICGICKENAKYCCPRCNLSFCSKVCYSDSQHAECSEKFYFKGIKTHMKDLKISREKQLETVGILKRYMTEYDESKSIDFGDYSEAWETLSEEEKSKFIQQIEEFKNGKIPSFMSESLFDPWWNISLKIMDVKDNSENKLPKLIKNLYPLKNSSSMDFSFHIFHIIISYAFIRSTYISLSKSLHEEILSNLSLLIPFLFEDSKSISSTSFVNYLDEVFEPHGQDIYNLDSNTYSLIKIYSDSLKIILESHNNVSFIFYALSDLYHFLKLAFKARNEKNLLKSYKKIKYYCSWFLDVKCSIIPFYKNAIEFRVSVLKNAENKSDPKGLSDILKIKPD